MDNHILPECYLDTNLIETLVPPENLKKGYNHQKGCNEVIRIMQKKFIAKFALGILDVDKDSPDKLQAKQFDFIDEQYSVKLYKHQIENHYLLLHPPIEKWLIMEAQQVNLSLEYYSLPSDLDKLKKQSKPATSKNNPRFRTVFQELKKEKANGITQLCNWMDYLMKNHENINKAHTNIGIVL